MKLVCQSQGCDSAPPKKALPKTVHSCSNSAELTADADNNTASPKLQNPSQKKPNQKSKIRNPQSLRAVGSTEPEAEIRNSVLPSSTKSATRNKKLSTLLDRVLESTTDGVIISNQNGEIILINSSVRKILGVSLASLPVPARQTGGLSSETSPQLNKSEGISDDVSTLNDLKASLSVMMVGSKIHLTEVVSSRDDEDLSDIIRRAHERLDVICEVPGSPLQVSQFKAGDERVIISISFPLKDAEGETICIVTVLRDMDEVRQLNRLKTEVFLKISHELRTPLTVIKGSVDNLLQGVGGKLTRKQESYLSQTRDSAEKLIQQIEKLLATN